MRYQLLSVKDMLSVYTCSRALSTKGALKTFYGKNGGIYGALGGSFSPHPRKAPGAEKHPILSDLEDRMFWIVMEGSVTAPGR
jgi:hypothetical protein